MLAEAQLWAHDLKVLRTALAKVGVFGSCERGHAGVGSDLDLLLVDGAATGPQQQRLLTWPLEHLPLSCDALVLTPTELQELLASGSRMAIELQRDLRWLLPHLVR